MRVLVVGGGKVGSYLARKLARSGHTVSVIEPRHDVAIKVVGETGVIVFEGDGTDVELLKRADVHRSDWVLAVSGKDDVNLVAAQLGRTLGAKKVLARLNDPANSPTFSALGIRTVAVTDLMVGVLERDLKVDALEASVLLAHGKLTVSEFEVGSAFEARPLQDVDIPPSSVIVAVERDDDLVVPRGPTMIRPGDRVVATSLVDKEGDLHSAFRAQRNPS
ncbi:MAG: NAD-binding protein [Acidimicrobiia bacterium]|nr:MAG: NAD-binding protein [Acidimicrobiia bacterium]